MKSNYLPCFKKTVFIILFIAGLYSQKSYAQTDFFTDYFKISINNHGFITSMKNISKTPNQEFIGKPSPLLCLYNSNKKIYYHEKIIDPCPPGFYFIFCKGY